MARAVLVVEDDPALQSEAIDMLTEAGHRILDFKDARQALDYVTANRDEIAAVFTDVQLEGSMSGVELAEAVATAFPAIAVIVTSGEVLARPPGLPAPVLFMLKPWRPLEVLSAIEKAVERRGAAS